MRKSGWVALATAVLAVAGWGVWNLPARGEASAATLPGTSVGFENPDPQRYLFEDQIRPGMKGYGLTVMSGGKIEKFDVDVIDVVKNFSPGNNAILVRCSGLGLEHSGIIAGMSGSPVFVNEKMIGAVAYGWGMAKDPIAGVQPIRQMLAIPEAKDGESAAGGGMRWSGDGLVARQATKLPGWGPLVTALARRAARGAPADAGPARTFAAAADGRNMRPLASPLMVSGLSAAGLKMLSAELADSGLVPIASGSGGGGGIDEKMLGGLAALKPADLALAPGSAIAVPLVSGDMDVSAIGTVTEVRKGKVYAFGHAFLGQGGVRLPIATSYIYCIMPNVSQSFKMGTSVAVAGTLRMDEEDGIVGTLGAAPLTVPVTITIKNGSTPAKIYKYQLSPHPKLTPEMLNVLLNETLVAQRNLPQQFTARITGEVNFAPAAGAPAGGSTLRSLKIEHVGATESFNPAMPLLPIELLVDNPYEDLRMTGLSLEADIEAVNRGGRILSVNINRLTVAPGDEIRGMVEIQPYQKEIVRVPISLKVPADVGDGDYSLTIGNSAMALEQESQYAPQRFDPQNIGGLTTAIEHILGYQPEHVYAQLVLDVSGAAVDGQEKANLPVSKLAAYASARRTDATPIHRVVTADVATSTILEDGGQSFTIHVDKKANERYYDASKAAPATGSAPRQPRVPLTTQPASAPAGDSGP